MFILSLEPIVSSPNHDFFEAAKDYGEFQENYAGEPDRSVAILAASYIETVLEVHLVRRLVSHKRVNRMFEGYGPLATFSAKIDLSYAVGLIPEHITDDLHIVRKVRNEFAHCPEKMDFSKKSISDLCQKISYSKGIPMTNGKRSFPATTAREAFLGAVYWSVLHIASQAERAPKLFPARHVWKEVVEDVEGG